jgi:hypothetical protein
MPRDEKNESRGLNPTVDILRMTLAFDDAHLRMAGHALPTMVIAIPDSGRPGKPSNRGFARPACGIDGVFDNAGGSWNCLDVDP